MNIDDLLKLVKILEPSKEDKKPPVLGSQFIGKYVIVRSRNEGVNAGKVIDLDCTGIILEDARRLYYHRPADKELSWYEGVAIEGISEDSKVGAAVTKVIIEDYSITICSEKAEKSIRNSKNNPQLWSKKT